MLYFAGGNVLLAVCKEEIEKALREVKEILTGICNMKINKKITIVLYMYQKKMQNRSSERVLLYW